MVSVILIILVAQVISVALVFYILKKILERRLFNLAIREFDFYSLPEGDQNPKEIFIITNKNIANSYRQEIEKNTQKKFGSTVKLVYQVDKELMGGIIIKVDRAIYNYSLRDRLKKSGFLK